MNPSFPCGSRIESAESAVSGTNPSTNCSPSPGFFCISLFSPSSVCQDPSLVDVQDDNNIQIINPCPHFNKEKTSANPEEKSDGGKKEKRKEGTKVQKLKLFFLYLFSFFLLLPFYIVFVAADNILKELSSLPFVFVCLFLVVWVSNSAGQLLPLL
jgi:hypothetical protein